MTGPVIASRLGGRDWMLRRWLQLFLFPWSAKHRGLSEAQNKTYEAQIELLNQIAVVLTAAGPMIWAGAGPPTEKAPLEWVQHCWSIWVCHEAV